MDRIIRTITSDGSLMAAAVDASDLVYTAQQIHKTGSVATAALGRLLTGAALMGAMLKKADASISLQINADGPLGALVAIADGSGNVRGYVENPQVELPLKDNGKLDVGAAVGHNGRLAVVRDFGSGEPYIGQVALVSGEIAEDITSYYATSEQIPTVCALGVLVDKSDHKALLAGGLFIQALPGAAESALSRLEDNLAKLEPVTTMLAKGMSMEEMCALVFDGLAYEKLDEAPVRYACTCSRERVQRAFATLQPHEIIDLADNTGYAQANCRYCGKNYRFSRKELEEIAKAVQQSAGEKTI